MFSTRLICACLLGLATIAPLRAATVTIDELPFTAKRGDTTYVLERDLRATGGAITIAADGVVIDGRGHSIIYADEGPGNGVRVDYPVSRLEVRNLTLIQGHYDPAPRENVHAIMVRGDHEGLDLHHNALYINHGGGHSGAYGWGISIAGNRRASRDNRIAHNVIEVRGTSAGYGISIDPRGPWHGKLHHNQIRLQGLITAPAGYSRAVALGGEGTVEVADNHIEIAPDVFQGQGISLWNADGHRIRGNRIEAAGAMSRGIIIDGDSDGTVVEGNHIRLNGRRERGASAGIRIRYGSDRTLVANNRVDADQGEEAFGIRIGDGGEYGKPRATVVRDNVFRSRSRAISVESGRDIQFSGNLAEGVGDGYALYVYASHQLRFDGDRLRGTVRLLGEGVDEVVFCQVQLPDEAVRLGTGNPQYQRSAEPCPGQIDAGVRRVSVDADG